MGVDSPPHRYYLIPTMPWEPKDLEGNLMTSLKSNETLRRWTAMFQRGVFPGAVAGAVVGLAPGILLILVLTGDSYHIGGAEVLGFIIMCIAVGALLGAGLGGVCAVAVLSLRRSLAR